MKMIVGEKTWTIFVVCLTDEQNYDVSLSKLVNNMYMFPPVTMELVLFC